jgi:hypothetical protein
MDCAHPLNRHPPHLNLTRPPAYKRETDLECKLWYQYDFLLVYGHHDDIHARDDQILIYGEIRWVYHDFHGCREGRRGFQRRNLANLYGIGRQSDSRRGDTVSANWLAGHKARTKGIRQIVNFVHVLCLPSCADSSPIAGIPCCSRTSPNIWCTSTEFS